MPVSGSRAASSGNVCPSKSFWKALTKTSRLSTVSLGERQSKANKPSFIWSWYLLSSPPLNSRRSITLTRSWWQWWYSVLTDKDFCKDCRIFSKNICSIFGVSSSLIFCWAEGFRNYLFLWKTLPGIDVAGSPDQWCWGLRYWLVAERLSKNQNTQHLPGEQSHSFSINAIISTLFLQAEL